MKRVPLFLLLPLMACWHAPGEPGRSSGATGTSARSGASGTSTTGGTASGSTGGTGGTAESSASGGSGASTSSSSGATSGSGAGSSGGFESGGSTGYAGWTGIQSCGNDTSNRLFLSPESFPVSYDNTLPGVWVGDVSGDGKPDVVSIGQDNWGGHVIVSRNVGDGLVPGSSVTVPFYPSGLRVADVNGDGIEDLLVLGEQGSAAGGEIGVFVSDGQGGWVGPTTYTMGKTAPSIALADLDGDGNPDLLAAPDSSPSIMVFLNRGDGTIGSPSTYAASLNASELTTVDANGDGLLDVVATMPTSGLQLFLNSGHGVLSNPTTIVPASSSNPLVKSLVGDIDGDGRPDLVAVRTSDLVVARADGAGAFNGSPQLLADAPSDALLGDLNGDGRADLVLFGGSSGAGWVSVRLGMASGSFDSAVTYPVCDVPVLPQLASIGASGAVSILYGYQNRADLGVALGDGTGALLVSDAFSNFYFKDYALADLNGDGKVDVVTASSGDGQVNVLLGR